MTRWARGNKGNNKRPHEASSWDELKEKKSQTEKHPRTTNRDEDTPVKPAKRSKKKGRKRQDEGFVKDGPSSSTTRALGHVISDSCIEEHKSSLGSGLSERLTATAPSTDPSEVDKTTLRKKDRKREERRVKRIKNKAKNMVGNQMPVTINNARNNYYSIYKNAEYYIFIT